jgi:hypothetical protein
MLNAKEQAKVQKMVDRYLGLLKDGWSHATASHAVISGTRGINKAQLVAAFLIAIENTAAKISVQPRDWKV